MGAHHPKKIASVLVSITLAGELLAMPTPSPPPQSGVPAASYAEPIADFPPAVKQTIKTRADSAPKSAWSRLSAAQQQALAPLSGDWEKLGAFRKEKWLELANRFSSMSLEEQSRMQDRMRDWVKLSPEQRRLARESYTRVKKLDTEQRAKQWEQYQQLSEEKKQELAASAKRKKQIVNPPRQHAGVISPQAKDAAPASKKQASPSAEVIQPSTIPLPSSTP